MKRGASQLASFIDQTSYVSGAAAAVMLLAMMLMLTLEVIMRYGFNTSTLIANEVGAYLFVALLYLALAHALQTGQHIKISVVVNRLSAKTQHRLGQVVVLLNLPIFAVLSWRAWLGVLESYRLGSASQTILHTPDYLPQLPIALGLTFLAIQGALELLRRFVR